MESLLLDKIDQPSDLKKLNTQQVKKLCTEIRHFMLENISKTGGHLASNLGTVELTVALHRVLETPKDKIVFDVGHQCYTHKLLTGLNNRIYIKISDTRSPLFRICSYTDQRFFGILRTTNFFIYYSKKTIQIGRIISFFHKSGF